MRIFFIANADSVHSHRWIRYFAEHTDHTIYWASVAPSIDQWFWACKNVKYYELVSPPKRLFFLNFLWRVVAIRHLIRSCRPDVVHAHYAGINGLLAALSGCHPRIVTAWGSDVLIAGKQFLKRFVVSAMLRTANLITCDAEHMKKAIMNFGVPEQKIHIIQFGIDTDRFSPSHSTKDIRSELNIVPDASIVISLRNFDPIYDLGTLMRAMPLVLEKLPKIVFLLVGKGGEKTALEALAKEFRVDRVVRFLGFIPNIELPDYLRASDLYVSTSLSDAGIASSTAEAMACEIPVVVTDSGENSLWVKDGYSGYVVPVQSPPLLAEKIIYLLSHQEERRQMGKNARDVIKKRDDYWGEMKKMDALYMDIYQQ